MRLPDPKGHRERGDGSSFTVVPHGKRGGRVATVSIALPSSILLNAQSPELRMYLAGQVARAAAIYCIDEIVIFREGEEEANEEDRNDQRRRRQDNESFNATRFFRHILEYLETPQYLRKHMFPVSRDLRLVGVLNPLALPSHVAKNEFCRWREGVAVGRVTFPRSNNRRPSIQGNESGAVTQGPPTRFVDVGQERLAEVDISVPVGTRVTVDMQPSGDEYAACPGKYLFGRLADPSSPKREDGTYWGYRVRVADSLSTVFQNSEVAPEGYDITIGTSERGTPILGTDAESVNFELPQFSHLLIVFGGVQGLERSVHGDERLQSLGISSKQTDNPSQGEGHHTVGDLFDFYVNTCPNQGSRTIRTEEAILVSLAALQPFLRRQNE